MVTKNNKIGISLYSLCRDDKSADFAKQQGYAHGFEDVNCISGLDYYQFLNRVITECRHEFALVCHDDVTFEQNFYEKINKAVHIIDKRIGSESWGVVGNAGIEMITHDIVRYIHDPYGISKENMFDDPVPLLSIDGNTLLLNIKNLRANIVQLPSQLFGFHMYDAILAMECYKKQLVCVAHANLFVHHKSSGNQKDFAEFVQRKDLLKYLRSSFSDEVFYTINGHIIIDNKDNFENREQNFENSVFQLFEKIYKEKKQLTGEVYRKLLIQAIEKKQLFKEKNDMIWQRDREIENKKEDIWQRDQEIQQLKQEISQKEQKIKFIKSSKFWKLRKIYLKIRNHGK